MNVMNSSENQAFVKQLYERDMASVWHPCGQMKDYERFLPLPVKQAKGVWFTLEDGTRVIDGISSWWCKALGHQPAHVMQAIAEQAQAFEHVILANTTNKQVVLLTERLLNAANGHGVQTWSRDCLKRLPGHFGKVFYADNGSTAVEIAMKMALHAQQHKGQTKRQHFVAFKNGYHGETVGAMSVSDLDWAASPYRGLCVPVTRLHMLPYRYGLHDDQWHDASEQWPLIEKQLEQVAEQTCAIIYEPMLQAAGSMRLFSPDLLVRLRQWADANGVYLIADEIAAGMGRLGYILASHMCGVDGRDSQEVCPVMGTTPSLKALPDFACISKGLTAGTLPLSAVLTTDEVYDLFYDEYASGKQFMHSNTYTGHALGVAAANAVLDVFAQAGVLADVQKRGPGLVKRLQELAATRSCVAKVRGLGFMAALDLVAKNGSALDASKRTGYQVYQAAVRRGALLRNLGDVMYLFPPLTSTEQELDQLVAILGQAIDEVMGV